MSSSKSPKLIHFMEQWEKLRIAVYEMSPYAKMINQVEEVLEDHSKSKEELAESNLELQDTKAREERLNFFIEEAMTRFEQRLLAVQEQHSSKMLEMNALLEEEKLSVASSRSAHEQSARRCMSLERELESQTRQLSAISEEHKALTSAIGLVDLDNTL
ncbi:hypothetical protein N7456_012540 [Penicillium angulare]|uniref:Uncharacterized protein n=1 Tax=Penicillium angulare TaxID=116970 RepID=A0A9W9EW04_9EURO|nr:hypothetical protein N7456_012540 [Penicillium angulare]